MPESIPENNQCSKARLTLKLKSRNDYVQVKYAISALD